MFARLISVVAAVFCSMLAAATLSAADAPRSSSNSRDSLELKSLVAPKKTALINDVPRIETLWEHLADRSAADAYRAARLMIGRGPEAVAFLAKKIPADARLPRRVPYDKPQELQWYRAAYVLECIGGKEAMSVRGRISYTPAAALQLYQEKPRLDPLGDALPSGAVFRWGSDRFFLVQGRTGFVAISGDGKLAAIAPIGYHRFATDDDAAIRIIDIATGRVRWRVDSSGMRPTRLVFTRDNKRLVYSAGEEIFVADIASGAIVNEISANPPTLTTFALADDERTIYIGHADGSLAAFEFPGGKRIAGGIARGSIVRLQVSPDFVNVECSQPRGIEAQLWDVRKKNWAVKKNWGEPGSLYALSSDGKRYAVLKPTGNITVRGMADDKLLKELTGKLTPGPNRTGRERFTFLDADHLYLSDWTGQSSVIAIDSGKVLWSGRTLSLNAEASADGRYLLGYDGGRLQIIDIMTGRNLIEGFLARLRNPYLTVSGDGGTVLGLSDDRLQQFHPSTLEPLGEIKMEGFPLALSYDGRFCVMQAPNTLELAVWEPASATRLVAINHFAGYSERYTFQFHLNGRWLIANNSAVSTVTDLWADAAGGPVAEYDRVGAVGAGVCSPDGRLSLYRDRRVREWTCCDAVTGAVAWHVPLLIHDYSSLPQWFAGGQFVAFPCGNAFEIREAKQGRVVDTIRVGNSDVRNGTISPDGESFVLADGASLRLFERCSRKAMFECPTQGFSVHFLAGGRFLEVGDQSGMTTVCDLSSAAAARKAKETAAEQMERLWSDLRGVDARAAFAASWAYISAGDEAVAYLARRMAAEREPGDEQIRRLIAGLDSDRYEMRHSAYTQLLDMGRRIEPKLKAAAEDPGSLEVRLALERLLRALESNRGPVLLPRAGFILRQIGTPQAEELLAKLGQYSAQKAFAPQPAPK